MSGSEQIKFSPSVFITVVVIVFGGGKAYSVLAENDKTQDESIKNLELRHQVTQNSVHSIEANILVIKTEQRHINKQLERQLEAQRQGFDSIYKLIENKVQ